jgi:hypothetical protein
MFVKKFGFEGFGISPTGGFGLVGAGFTPTRTENMFFISLRYYPF